MSTNDDDEERSNDNDDHHHHQPCHDTSLTSPLPSPTTPFPIDEFPTDWKQSLSFPALLVPVRRTAELRKRLASLLLRRPQTKSVYPASDGTKRILLLANSDALKSELVVDAIRHCDCSITTYTLELDYPDLTAEEVLRTLLPPETTEIPSSYELVGHLAHINLRNELLPYKYWIGKVLLDKNQPTIHTVVNKVGTIETEFRTFGMEVVAGNSAPGWSLVQVKEERCIFELDFTQVYWNSRLAGEHKRLVSLIGKESRNHHPMTVLDLMAGVGPFAVPLTSPAHGYSHVTVHANDLNPSSYKYLVKNAQRNKCRNLHCYNEDARTMVQRLCIQPETLIDVHHVIMNLPASAPEFLNAFGDFTGPIQPWMHVHCFAPKQSEARQFQDALDRCAQSLGRSIDRVAHQVRIHIVRDVSPRKFMLCVSFRLPTLVHSVPPVLDTKEEPVQDNDKDAKRRRVEA
jgi:tRNA (guanine37-N1)-methyltransferase